MKVQTKILQLNEQPQNNGDVIQYTATARIERVELEQFAGKEIYLNFALPVDLVNDPKFAFEDFLRQTMDTTAKELVREEAGCE